MPRRLPLRKILWGAFALPWQHRAEVARADGTMWEFGVLLVLTSIFTVIQVVALSLSYWELTQPEPPPMPPPA